MGVRKFGFKGKTVYMDELFNISEDKEQDDHLGVLQVNAGGEFYIAPKPRRRDLKQPFEKDLFDQAKALFVRMAKRAEEKKLSAPVGAGKSAVSLPTPVVAATVPAVVQRTVASSEGGAVTVKRGVGKGLKNAQDEQDDLEEELRRGLSAAEKKAREEEQAYYMAEE
jgi:hypothetical protein